MQVESSAIRVAVVGAGYWGKNLVRNFREIGSLAVVCDRDPSVEALCRGGDGDVRYEADFAAVLADPQISAVALATPAVTHYEMASAALIAGKDVFVEKPLAVELSDGERLVATAQERRRVLMVGHVLRYHPAILKIQELVRDGALGKIQYVYSNRLNIGKIRSEENILWSFAPHDISVILALLGESPGKVFCRGAAYLNRQVFDVTMSYLDFPSGVQAHIFVSWLHPVKEQKLVVVGSEKMAVFDDTADDKLLLYPHRVEWRNRIPTAIKAAAEIVPLEQREPLRAECEHFVEGVVIEPRIPMHASRFEPVARALRPVLEQVGWKPAARPYLPNVLGHFVEDPGPAQLVSLLSQHVHRPVLWRHSVDFIAGRVERAVFVEVGPRRVLCNSLNRKWVSNPRFATDPGDDHGGSLDPLIDELSRAA